MESSLGRFVRDLDLRPETNELVQCTLLGRAVYTLAMTRIWPPRSRNSCSCPRISRTPAKRTKAQSKSIRSALWISSATWWPI